MSKSRNKQNQTEGEPNDLQTAAAAASDNRAAPCTILAELSGLCTELRSSVAALQATSFNQRLTDVEHTATDVS